MDEMKEDWLQVDVDKIKYGILACMSLFPQYTNIAKTGI